MKKIFACFAVFAALIFVIGCGGDTDDAQFPECSASSGTPCKDSSSGLIWSARSSSSYTWSNAVSYCDNLTEGGYSDWHLPNINELRTLIKNCAGSQTGGSCAVQDPSCLSSSCYSSSCYCSYMENNGGYYSKLGDTGWFCSSSITDFDDFAWLVDFSSGDVNGRIKVFCHVRCVR